MKQASVKIPPNMGWLEVVLDDSEMNHLWECIRKGGERFNSELAGNISRSFKIDDRGNWFFKNTLKTLCDLYKKEFGDMGSLAGCSGRHPYFLENFWVNYQKQNEFNPMHVHSGIYSFVIWMKIPTKKKDQLKVNEFTRVNNQQVVSDFSIAYQDILGAQTGYRYEMNPDMEGNMIFFPARLPHIVYPFYKSGKDRISISGNITLDTSCEKKI
tara:strand:+ start:53 stop:691 length:639 start_codon:yes stop_codon:yes gene_type:complete